MLAIGSPKILGKVASTLGTSERKLKYAIDAIKDKTGL
jgi:hypothetical protein